MARGRRYPERADRERTGVKRPAGSINTQGTMHVADIMPTLLEVAGTSYPKTYKGKDLPPALGKSWVPVLEGRAESPRTEQDVLAWELFGNRALRQGTGSSAGRPSRSVRPTGNSSTSRRIPAS